MDTIELLLKHRANINDKSVFGYTALMNACSEKNNLDTIELLLEHRANINDKNNDGNTALLFASRIENDLDTIELLLKNGASINDKNNYGDTALLFACRNNRIKTILLLLDNGANQDIIDEDDKNALDSEIIELLNNRIKNKYLKYKKKYLQLKKLEHKKIKI